MDMDNIFTTPSPSSSFLPPPPPSHQWLVAVGLSLGATLVNNVGMLHMKYSMMENSLLDDITLQKPTWKQVRWVIGFSAYIVGQLGAMVSLGFGPQSMMAALGAFSLVVNVFTSPCILGEKVTCYHVSSTFLIIAGVIIVVCFSKKKAQHYTITQLEHRFQQIPFLITASILFCVLLLMFVKYGLRQYCSCCNRRVQSNEEERGKPSNKAGNQDEDDEDDEDDSNQDNGLPPLYCAFIASICSASTNLCAKCTMAILMAHTGDEWLTSLPAWFIIFGLITTAVGTVVFLNLGLNSDDGALFIIPVFFVMVLLCTTLVAAVFFGDFDAMPVLDLAMLAVGAVLTLVGVYALASYDVNNDPLADCEADMEEPLLAGGASGASGASGAGDGSQKGGRRSSSQMMAAGATSIQTIQRHVRRASSKRRFSLNPHAYAESFVHRRRLGSVMEEGAFVEDDEEAGVDEGKDREGDRHETTGRVGKNGSRRRSTRGGSSVLGGGRRKSRRSRTYSANVLGGLGVV